MSEADGHASDQLERPEEVRSDAPATTSDFVIPLVGEELDVHKYLVDRATVRLTKIIHDQSETIKEQLASEHVEIERVPRNEIVDSPPSVRMDGDVMIIPVLEEILVVPKQLRLKEELRVSKKQIVNEYREDVTLRSQEVTVERCIIDQLKSLDPTHT